MITINITSKSFTKGTLLVSVTYGGDVESFTETYQVGSAKELENRIRVKVDQLTGTMAFANTLTVGNYTLPTGEATQAGLEEQQFLQDLARWRSVKNAIDLGILTGNETQVVALLNKVKSEFKPAYLNII